ncbi:MAG: DUF3108 domain-containing protein [Longimicrobiales bacterium]
MRPHLLFPLSLVCLVVVPSLLAQVTGLPTRVEPRLEASADVPFGPGEMLKYDVRLGAFGRRGEGYMEVVGLDSVRGHTTYHVTMSIAGGLLFAKVNDHYQSWFDVTNLVTRRFIQDVDEINYERFRHWELYPEERRFERPDNGREGDLPTDLPLDDVSFLYFVRTLPLEVGDEYSFDRYFREGGNPVVIRVLRKDTVTVPAGTFETVAVQPVIQTKGLFSQGGEAELHFTTDERRLMVYMKSKVPLVGALSLHLAEITEGTPLRAPSGSPSAPGDDLAGGHPTPEARDPGGSGSPLQ